MAVVAKHGEEWGAESMQGAGTCQTRDGDALRRLPELDQKRMELTSSLAGRATRSFIEPPPEMNTHRLRQSAICRARGDEVDGHGELRCSRRDRGPVERTASRSGPWQGELRRSSAPTPIVSNPTFSDMFKRTRVPARTGSLQDRRAEHGRGRTGLVGGRKIPFIPTFSKFFTVRTTRSRWRIYQARTSSWSAATAASRSVRTARARCRCPTSRGSACSPR